MALTSQQRLQKTLNHETPDRVCVDFGATGVTGIAATAVHKLRHALIGDPEYQVKIIEPYQMLGEIDAELEQALGVDVRGVGSSKTMFGFENKDWKPFTLFDGTKVLVPGEFNVTPDGQGGWYMHPEGDTQVPPSGHMPKDGFYFDAIPRQEPINDDSLDPADNLEEFTRLSDSEIQEMVNAAKEIQAEDKGIVLALPGTGFGDIALVPAVWRKQTRGIRDIEEWYISTALRPDYVRTVFEGQLEVAIQNLEKLMPALGPFADAAFITGTDFGTQNGPFISPKTYRDLYKPFHKTINDTIHRHTNWKTFIHSCGSVVELIPDFIDAGFDILNPVQISAAGMEARELVKHFGKDIVFWGGGVDTQKTLPFGTPEEVYRQVRERIDIFNPGGGFVFNTIHNIQATTPLENMLAMIRAIQDSGKA